MWLQSFSELLFSLQQSSKNLVSFDFSPLAGKWHIWGRGIKVWSLGRRGQGYCFRAHKQLQVQKMCTRKGRSGRGPFKMWPFKFNKSLCSLSRFVSCARPSHALMHIPVSNVASRRNLHVCCEVFRNYIIIEACEFVLRWLKKCKPEDYSNIIRLLPVRAKWLFLGQTLIGCPQNLPLPLWIRAQWAFLLANCSKAFSGHVLVPWMSSLHTLCISLIKEARAEKPEGCGFLDACVSMWWQS